MLRLISTGACAALLFAPWAHAQEDQADQEKPADVVVLSSGNRLIGEILALDRGELSFSIDGAGSVDIDWNNVETLQSPRLFDVELASGERLSGSIASPARGRIAVASGTSAAAVGTEDVVRISPITSPAEGISGSVDLGAEFLSASDELDIMLNAELEKRTRNYRTTLMIDSVLSEIDNETEQRRNYLELVSRRLLGNRWFAVGRLDVEENRALDLDSRALIGAGGGRELNRSNRAVLALYGGLDYARERLRDTDATDGIPEAFASLEWSWFEVGGDVEVSTHATTFFDLDESRRRVELDLSFRRTIIGNMYWSVNVYESYNSDPPEGVDNSDLGLAFALGRSF
jgi:hypothetical protein